MAVALDPQMEKIIQQLQAVSDEPLAQKTVQEVRALSKLLSQNQKKEEVKQIREEAIPGPAGLIPIRIYRFARERKGPRLACQLLIYPVTDANFETASYLSYGKGYFFEKEDLMWCWDHYLPNYEARKSPYASPLRANNLAELPPAIVVTAEYTISFEMNEKLMLSALRNTMSLFYLSAIPGWSTVFSLGRILWTLPKRLWSKSATPSACF
jgi:hypothetical protein